MILFESRKYSVIEIKDWYDRGDLDLRPKFQRLDVWDDKARSYLIDTIIRGKPIPKIYMRTITNTDTGRMVREIVDGQQRLKGVFLFLDDAFPILKAHNEQYAAKYFSKLSKEVQNAIRAYPFTIDFLFDIPDKEVWDIFARLNRYPVKLNAQELRNSQFFGEFKSTAYQLANDYSTFWIKQGILTDKQKARMADAELTADLLIAASQGMKDNNKKVLDKAFEDFDDKFPNRQSLTRRFRATLDFIGELLDNLSEESNFRRVPIFYTLFCTVYHMQFGLPAWNVERASLKHGDIPRLIAAMENIDRVLDVPKDELTGLSLENQKFRGATDVHTVHASNRLIRASYVTEHFRRAVQR